MRDDLAIPIVYVSHQFDEVLRLATHVVLLDNGRAVAQGGLDAVCLHPELRAIVGPDAVGAVLTGSIAGLLFAYAVRFVAVGFQTVDASLGRLPRSFDDAARSLGSRVGGTLCRVQLPLLRRGMLTALILVFVETMKEMPATLLLRPFGLSTLATAVWERTSESLWAEAAVPALALVLAGLLPVFVALRLSAAPSVR
jgi:iron(III) transport system permease protein